MSEKKLFLIDGMALVYRGHFALIRSPRLTSTGMNTSAPFVTANVVMEILNKEKPTHIACVFDTPEPTHRHLEYAEYKAQREEMPEDLSVALPYCVRLFEAMNIPVIKMPGYEADDVIGTLARQAEKEGFTTFMATPDKDYAQLVDENTFMYKPGRSGSGADVLGVKEILDEWEISRVEQVIDILGLMGDKVDNVPGVPGIGEKTAKKLIADFGSVENLLDNVDELKGKQKESLIEYREQALLSKRLVTIDCNVPVTINPNDLIRKELDLPSLQQLFAELEFKTLGKRWFGDDFDVALQRVAEEQDGETVTLETISEVDHDYKLVASKEERAALIAEMMKREAVCFDLETTGLNPKTCEIVGIALSYEPKKGFYVPLPTDQTQAKAILDEFRPFLESDVVVKVGHNTKYDLSVLRWHGIHVSTAIFDSMLAAHLATPDLKRNMDYLAEALLGYRPVSIKDLIGERGEEQRTMREVDVETVKEYAAEDADITFQLYEKYKPLLKEQEQERVFYEVECPLVPVLVEMEYEGIRLDPEVLHAMSGEWERLADEARDSIFKIAGEEINLNSPKQLGEIMFDKLDIEPKPPKTKTGQYQTNEQILSRLAPNHEIAQLILDHRMYTRLKTNYVDQLPDSIYARTGRIHTNYEQAVTATGRMQSSGPNLQNIPIRSEKGQEIRKAFVARNDDYLLLAADYSQIELRIAAEISKDEGLMQAFANNEDIHTATAARVYKVSSGDVTPDMRSKAKMVNFGILYGISAFGLAQRLNVPRAEASELIDTYFEQFPGVRNYMDETIAFARAHGYAETLMGRRRYFRDINSANATSRGSEERNAINSRIQGSAADMIKIAMVKIHNEIQKRGLKSRMLLQVHDELVFDMHKSEENELKPLVDELMRTAIPMSVPILVEMGTGTNWLDAH
ncbi:MAG: DNA polymerase I [Candidatus Poribacteria bacterium]|nr:DNA polymerase I [Candidatus Poribacteria bacterium]